MGVVRMDTETSFISRGYPYNKATLYIYCDICGSFNIKKHQGFMVFFGGNPIYKCTKCGKTTTTRYNTRNLPSEKSVVDVSEQLIQKHYLEYWPDEGDIDKWLQKPE